MEGCVCVCTIYKYNWSQGEPGTIYFHESEYLQPQIKATFQTDIRDPWREETQARQQGCEDGTGTAEAQKAWC